MLPRLSLSGPMQGSPLRVRARWHVRAVTGLLWAAVAGCAVFWVLQLALPPGGPAGAPPAARLPDPPDPQSLARLLGAGGGAADAQAAPSAGARRALVGVGADASGGGAALISVDGAPAQPVRVGRRVQGELWLQSLKPRGARLGPAPDGPTTLTLDLPDPETRAGPHTP